MVWRCPCSSTRSLAARLALRPSWRSRLRLATAAFALLGIPPFVRRWERLASAGARADRQRRTEHRLFVPALVRDVYSALFSTAAADPDRRRHLLAFHVPALHTRVCVLHLLRWAATVDALALAASAGVGCLVALLYPVGCDGPVSRRCG